MNKRIKSLASVLALALATSAHASAPTLAFRHSPTFDAVCALFKGSSIKDAWEDELTRRQPELEAMWRRIGPSLVASAEEITGSAFPEGDQTVRLTLCELPSQSLVGISINMRYAMSSFTQSPVPLRYKADTVFHELLHKFLAQHPPKDSRLLKTYANEPERTRGHLHLLALQKAVLLKLHASAELADVVRIDSQLPGGYYKRAWAIVNATDTTYQQFVEEITRR